MQECINWGSYKRTHNRNQRKLLEKSSRGMLKRSHSKTKRNIVQNTCKMHFEECINTQPNKKIHSKSTNVIQRHAFAWSYGQKNVLKGITNELFGKGTICYEKEWLWPEVTTTLQKAHIGQPLYKRHTLVYLMTISPPF